MPATLPEAPVTFSITTVCPSVFRIFSARMRASTSVGPPAANGTISVIGRDGKLSARDEIGHAAAIVPTAAVMKSRRLMRCSPWGFFVVESHSTSWQSHSTLGHCEERKRRSNPILFRGEETGLLRGACHRGAHARDPLARNDG